MAVESLGIKEVSHELLKLTCESNWEILAHVLPGT